MLMATAYYVMQEAPAARVTRWLKRDLAVNAALFFLLAFTLLDGIQGSIVLDLRASGAIASSWRSSTLCSSTSRTPTTIGPIRRSPVPVRPARSVWIDWLTAALVLGALFLL